MDVFNVLTFIGGISLFLYGMSAMSKALEKRAGNKLRSIVKKMTQNPFFGLLTGALVTGIIQSSSATTVMVVGFVNSGVMTLGQSIGVIMGANIGTTVTSWILSLTGISSSNVFIKLLKPSAWSPILALIGIILYMFTKSEKKKDLGMIFIGFAVLMFGMETMSSSVSGLKEVEWFKNLFISFANNPWLGVLVGLAVTAIIQSSSASIGILQSFALTGQITYAAAIPIILGQNIGTCVTAILSSIGTNKNAKRASLVHLLFNVIGTVIALIIYIIVWQIVKPAILDESASIMGIAVIHTSFNVGCTVLLFPFSKLLEKLVCKIIPDRGNKKDVIVEFDDRLLKTPAIALEQVKDKIGEMVVAADTCLNNASQITTGKIDYNVIAEAEDKTDHYEDLIGSYLVRLSKEELGDDDSKAASIYLKMIGDLERLGDHSLNIAEISKEMKEQEIVLSDKANEELNNCFKAINNIWSTTKTALKDMNVEEALKVEPLEQVIDVMVKIIRNNHIKRVQNDECSIDKGFVLADLLSNIERISDHCSNLASYILDSSNDNLNSHENILTYRKGEHFNELFDKYYSEYVDTMKTN